MKNAFINKICLLIAIALGVVVVAVACASPEPPTATPNPPSMPAEMPNPPEMNELTEEMPAMETSAPLIAYPPSVMHPITIDLSVETPTEITVQSRFFDRTTIPPTRDEAPYPHGTVPVRAVETWELGIRDLEKRIGACQTAIGSHFWGYVKNQLIVSLESAPDDPIATISNMLREAGVQFDRIEIFTAEDYAQYDSNSFINYLVPNSYENYLADRVQDYDFWQTLRDDFNFLLSDSAIQEFQQINTTSEDIIPLLPVREDRIRYQVKIYADSDLNLFQLRELRGVGMPIEFVSATACLGLGANRFTLYHFAGGVWTTFGDDLIWFNPPCSMLLQSFRLCVDPESN